MPRKPRFNLVGIPQHIIQRGNNRAPCFFADDDYRRYLHDLRKSSAKYDCRIHAYVLMTNHVHLLVTPMVEHGISHMMQGLGRRYVCYINKTYNRTGTLWDGRYKSSLVDSDYYLLTCMRYIELNPVRASMVEHPGEYPWSSYLVNAHGRTDSIVAAHPLYSALGEGINARQAAYRRLFLNRMGDDLLHDIRDSLNHEVVLGRAYFKDKIESLTKRQTRLGLPGRPRIEEESGGYYVGY